MMKKIDLPYLLDFVPLQDEKYTKIYPFYENLKKGKLTTTKCKKCREILWQPRIVCPNCLSDDLEWIELPKEGKLFAFTEMNAGAPIGFEEDIPFLIGIIELDNVGIKILSRIEDAKYDELDFDMKMEMKVISLEDGRVIYRFKPSKPQLP